MAARGRGASGGGKGAAERDARAGAARLLAAPLPDLIAKPLAQHRRCRLPGHRYLVGDVSGTASGSVKCATPDESALRSSWGLSVRCGPGESTSEGTLLQTTNAMSNLHFYAEIIPAVICFVVTTWSSTSDSSPWQPSAAARRAAL